VARWVPRRVRCRHPRSRRRRRIGTPERGGRCSAGRSRYSRGSRAGHSQVISSLCLGRIRRASTLFVPGRCRWWRCSGHPRPCRQSRFAVGGVCRLPGRHGRCRWCSCGQCSHLLWLRIVSVKLRESVYGGRRLTCPGKAATRHQRTGHLPGLAGQCRGRIRP